MIEAIILALPVALAFYFIGKWLKKSEKRDETRAEEKLESVIVEQNKPQPIKNKIGLFQGQGFLNY